jgi:pilus assembly protein CpaE
MLSAVIVGTDKAANSLLRATLQQTGLVRAVREWEPVAAKFPSPEEPIPDLVLLDLPADADPFFEFSAHLRKQRPALHIFACSQAPPEPSLLLQAMRSGVQEFLTQPVTVEALKSAMSLLVGDGAGQPARQAEKAFVVAGSKGGMGTSTVTVNLGVQIENVTKKRVALLDFARPFGHLSLLLDLKPRFTIRDAIENIDRLDAHFLGGLVTRHKTGLEVLAGAANAEDRQHVTVPALARIVNVAQSAFDFLLLDVGCVDFSEWAPVMRLARSILLVTEPSLLALWTLERHLATAVSAGLDRGRIQVVINRWQRGDEVALVNVEKSLKLSIRARLPNDYRAVSEAVTQGMPLTQNANNPLVARYRELASFLTGNSTAAPERTNALAGLFSGRK